MTTGAIDLTPVIMALRDAGARFAYLHGSQVEGTARDGSDIDVGAHFGGRAPQSWQLRLPEEVDLVVLDAAPLYLAGRVALRGRLLFDDDPPQRVRWEAETRVRYLDELPYLEASTREYLEAVGRRGRS